jgi:hypothetical protein
MNTIIKPICDDKSLLLVKEASVNINKLRELMSSGIKVSPLVVLSICHWMRLLNYLTSTFYKSII